MFLPPRRSNFSINSSRQKTPLHCVQPSRKASWSSLCRRPRELPWLEKSQIPAGAQLITDPNQSLINVDATYAVSDTGELRRDWGQGTYTIDTPRSQAAMGWIGGKQINLADVSIAVTTRNATVAVQSLDQANISESHSILISLGARSVPESGNRMPFHSEPVVGRLTIRARKGLKLYKQLRVRGSSTRNPHHVREWPISDQP